MGAAGAGVVAAGVVVAADAGIGVPAAGTPVPIGTPPVAGTGGVAPGAAVAIGSGLTAGAVASVVGLTGAVPGSAGFTTVGVVTTGPPVPAVTVVPVPLAGAVCSGGK